jgi:hypothetical protein
MAIRVLLSRVSLSREMDMEAHPLEPTDKLLSEITTTYKTLYLPTLRSLEPEIFDWLQSAQFHGSPWWPSHLSPLTRLDGCWLLAGRLFRILQHILDKESQAVLKGLQYFHLRLFDSLLMARVNAKQFASLILQPQHSLIRAWSCRGIILGGTPISGIARSPTCTF